MTPNFFFLSARGDETDGFPWATTLYGTHVRESLCPICNREFSHEEGPGHAELQGGKRWPDIVSAVTGPSPMVTERVVDTVRKHGIGTLEAYPVRLEKLIGSRLDLAAAESYFYIWVRGQMLTDLRAEGITQEAICPACHRPLPYKIRRHVLLADSWDGSDIFRLANDWVPICCTLRVVELARQHRWTNFRFVPIDADQRHVSHWDGIEYLGKHWPPAQWYPPAPSSGKLLEQWLEQMDSDDYVEVARASDALRDLEVDAVPGLIRFMERGREAFHRFWAARALVLLPREGVQIPRDVFETAEQIMFENENESNPHLFTRDASGRLRSKV